MFLFIVIIIFVVYILIFVKKEDIYKNDPLYNYFDIRKKLKTGDLILFSCKKSESLYKSIEYYFRTNFIGSEYGHVGIIFKSKNNNLYVIECTSDDHCAEQYAKRLNNYGKGGVRIVPLDILFKEYDKKNSGVFAIKFISREIPNSLFIEKLKKYQNYTFDNKKLLYIFGIIDVVICHWISSLMIDMTNKNKIICSGFVHSFLYDCNILKEYPSKIFWPHFITSEKFKDLEIVKYSKPYKFTFNKQNNNNDA